jgi:uncharacterized protein
MVLHYLFFFRMWIEWFVEYATLIVPILAFVFTVVGKAFFYMLTKRSLHAHDVFGSGGMPSSHSAIVSSITMLMGLRYGLGSDLFVVCFVFSSIIIYDAVNLRFQAGLHAKTLNELKNEKFLKESLGHMPQEAFVGMVVGVLTAVLVYNIVW